jgi:hypothetical protein
MEYQPHAHGLEDKMIALAYFEWVLKRDRDKARHWIRCFQATGVSLHHYAAWLREHYKVVVTAVEEPVD